MSALLKVDSALASSRRAIPIDFDGVMIVCFAVAYDPCFMMLSIPCLFLLFTVLNSPSMVYGD